MLFPGVIANHILQGEFSTFDDSCLFKGGHSVGPCSPVERRFSVDFVFFLAAQTNTMLGRPSNSMGTMEFVQRARLCVLKAGLLYQLCECAA